ncbi:hypothetical protein [Pantoea ananatis]|uniref:hypothetical protein n=1 Tax=Pantoea ananas TaxID=553 RepID=UPI001B30DD96|nr:hypothetical protein [Pantoea ananatis]
MDVKMLATSLGEGLVSLPMDFYLGIERTFQDLNISDGGRATQRRNYYDDQRLVRALMRLFRDRNVLANVAKIIVNDALSKLPEPALQKLHDKLIGGAVKMTSRAALQISITGYLGSKVVSGMLATTITRLSLRLWTGSLVGGIALQGIISRAADASRRLQKENPELWQKLYINDYDMIYFLFEKPLANFLMLSSTLRNNPAQTEQLLREIDNL